MQIIPAILTADATESRSLLEKISSLGKFGRVQFDFIDGEYTNNKTITPEEVDLTPFLGLEFDAHLMVVENNAAEYVKQAGKVGFDRIIVQSESVSHPENYSGLALDIHSPVESIQQYLSRQEVVVVMAIEPGFGGQDFDDETIQKVMNLSDLRIKNNWGYAIQVDGGVQKENLETLEKAGADEVVVGAKRVLEWM